MDPESNFVFSAEEDEEMIKEGLSLLTTLTKAFEVCSPRIRWLCLWGLVLFEVLLPYARALPGGPCRNL